MLKKKGGEIALRPKEFYEKYDIEVALKKEVHNQTRYQKKEININKLTFFLA